MIENYNKSKEEVNFIDIPKYKGVASVKVLAINPDNAALRRMGWQVSETADEPVYITEKTLDDGTIRRTTRIRFMVQIQDFDHKPIVPLDFFIRPEVFTNKDSTKCQIIDSYGRTAWATKEEVKERKIPMYSNGEANISSDYKPSHPGQEELVLFLKSYLCCTPYQVFNQKTGQYEKSKNPGKLTIDNWKALCNGDVTEIKQYISFQPDNLLKVIFGINHTEDNKDYQAFCRTRYIANGASPSLTTGVYTSATKAISKEAENEYSRNVEYSDRPVIQWSATPTEIEQAPAPGIEDMPDFSNSEDDTFGDF